MDLYKQAMTVAETFDVSSPENSVVLYSISYLPTTRNRDLAFDCVRSNPGKMMIEHGLRRRTGQAGARFGG